jgi:hypothetical protein
MIRRTRSLLLKMMFLTATGAATIAASSQTPPPPATDTVIAIERGVNYGMLQAAQSYSQYHRSRRMLQRHD